MDSKYCSGCVRDLPLSSFLAGDGLRLPIAVQLPQVWKLEVEPPAKQKSKKQHEEIPGLLLQVRRLDPQMYDEIVVG